MAINYTISYTFSPGTTISSSQVNTNFSDNANTWTGLEALTKSFSNLRVDTLPTTTTDVAIKSYVDKLNNYRRPVLQFGSVTTVAVESGLDGTSGDIPLLFPDGTLRTETSTTRTTFDITRNAVLVTSGAQSGLTGATSEANNTWYALYGCKVTDSSTLWVTVGSTVLPLRANFATLNTAYGTNGWVYLGMIRNGNNDNAVADILKFFQSGNVTHLTNASTAAGVNMPGTLLASSASATTTTYTATFGTGATDVPNHLALVWYTSASIGGGAGTVSWRGGSAQATYFSMPEVNTIRDISTFCSSVNDSFQLVSTNAGGKYIYLSGFIDGVLGVGANPIL